MRGTTTLVAAAALGFVVAATVAHPAAAQPTPLGSSVVIEGTVAMSIEDDFRGGRATRNYFLDRSSSGGRYDLRLTPSQARMVQPGMRVRVIGRLAGNVLTAGQADDSVVVLDPSPPVAPGPAR